MGAFGLLQMKGLAPLDSGVLRLFTEQKWEQLSDTCYTSKACTEYLKASCLQTPSLHFTCISLYFCSRVVEVLNIAAGYQTSFFDGKKGNLLTLALNALPQYVHFSQSFH